MHVHVISHEGVDIEGIETQADSQAAADAVLQVLLPLVGDPGCQVRASIAGGRKTMGLPQG